MSWELNYAMCARYGNSTPLSVSGMGIQFIDMWLIWGFNSAKGVRFGNSASPRLMGFLTRRRKYVQFGCWETPIGDRVKQNGFEQCIIPPPNRSINDLPGSCLRFALQRCRRRWYDALKCRLTFSGLDSVISQETNLQAIWPELPIKLEVYSLTVVA
jgi:hypothetical protein